MAKYPNFTLNNGAKVPSILFGSYKAEGAEGVEAMEYALTKAHYGGIDTASRYGNHNEVRAALQKSQVPRESLVLQTKIWPTQMREPEKFVDQFIEELGTYIDVLLIHWPFPLKDDKVLDEDWDFVKTWKLMEKLPKHKVRSIGVSNFRIKDLEKLLAETEVVPVVNQCELHPELPQQDLVDFCLAHQIRPEAYRPLVHGGVDIPILKQLADKYGVDVGQVGLSWNVKRGVLVLPKTVTPSRIDLNIEYVELSDEDMQAIAEVGNTHKRTCGSENYYGFDYFGEAA